MANSIYTQAKTLFGTGELDWVDGDFTVLVLDPDGTAAHSTEDLYWSDVSDFVLGSAALTGKTVTDGVFDANDVNSIVINVGETMDSIVIVHDSGDPDQPTREATSELIVFMDLNDNLTDITRAGEGAVIPIRWSDGPARIFRMV